MVYGPTIHISRASVVRHNVVFRFQYLRDRSQLLARANPRDRRLQCALCSYTFHSNPSVSAHGYLVFYRNVPIFGIALCLIWSIHTRLSATLGRVKDLEVQFEAGHCYWGAVQRRRVLLEGGDVFYCAFGFCLARSARGRRSRALSVWLDPNRNVLQTGTQISRWDAFKLDTNVT